MGLQGLERLRYGTTKSPVYGACTNTQRSRALAQKLSIRLGKKYRNSKLIEVDSHSLFSKFFGESGKLVGLLFEEVERLLEREKDTFICILIDEVESLTSARDQVAGHNEPRDGLRV